MGHCNVMKNYRIIIKEIKKSEFDLTKKEQIVVLTKTDLIPTEELLENQKFFKKKRISVCAISSATRFGISDLSEKIIKLLQSKEVNP